MSPVSNNPSSIETQVPESNHAAWLREQIAELKKRWPPHSVPPWMLQRLDDLEEELQNELNQQGERP